MRLTLGGNKAQPYDNTYARTEKVPVYTEFLRETEEALSNWRTDFQPINQAILALLEDGRANAAFNDYLYLSQKETVQKLFDLLGNCWENNYLVMEDAERERFKRLLEKNFSHQRKLQNFSFVISTF